MEEIAAAHLLEHSESLGHTDFRERVEMIRRVLSDRALSADEIVAQGNIVAWRWHITGEHRGKWMGFVGTGRKVILHGLSVDRFEDGRSVEHWEFPDLVDLANQLDGSQTEDVTSR